MNRIRKSTALLGNVHNHGNTSCGFDSLENALKQAGKPLVFCTVACHAMRLDMSTRISSTALPVGFHFQGFSCTFVSPVFFGENI